MRDDTNELTPDDVESGIEFAVSRYSKDRPRSIVEDVVAPGGQFLPTAWVGGFSEIQALEYPIGSVPPNLLEGFGIYEAPGGEEIHVTQRLPDSVNVRISFTVFHILSQTVDTVPLADREPLACYAAAHCCEQLASLFSGDSDSSIQADSVDHAGAGDRFSRRADKLRRRYFDELGIEPKRNQAAGVVVDMDLSDSLGRDRLLHSGRYR